MAALTALPPPWLALTAFAAGGGVVVAASMLVIRRLRLVTAMAEQRSAELREELEAVSEARQESETELRRLAQAQGRDSALAESRGAALEELRARYDALEQSLEASRRDGEQRRVAHAALESRLGAVQESAQERERLLETAEARLRDAFEHLADRTLEARGEQLGNRQREQLQAMLEPLREQIGEFRRRVDDVHAADSRERASLRTEVDNLQQASAGINREAHNLTRALTGDKKLQGSWGEVVLERVLEASGLRRGHEFEVQTTERAEGGAVQRPDVIVRLPQTRDVVIDAKVSLVAWEHAHAADDTDARERALRRHTQNMRHQVVRLGEQRYDRLPGISSPEFVLLFVPVEAALGAALERDGELLPDALARHVIPVGPSTLLLALRIVEQTWRRDRQSREVDTLARRASALHDRLERVVQEFDRMGRQLQTLERTWREARRRLTDGRHSAMSAARRLAALDDEPRTATQEDAADAAAPSSGQP